MDFMKSWGLFQIFSGTKKEKISERVEEGCEEAASDESEWTESDSKEIMDIMESALEIVKESILQEQDVQIEESDDENCERLENLIVMVDEVNREVNEIITLITKMTTGRRMGSLSGLMLIFVSNISKIF